MPAIPSPARNPRTFLSSALWCLALALMLALLAGRMLTAEEDLWGHAAAGRWIWEHKAVPHQTLFMWTITPQQWISHSWGSQLFLYGLLQNGGQIAVICFTISAVLITYGILWWLGRRQGMPAPLLAAIIALSAIPAWPRYKARPELFTAIIMSLVLAYLITRKDWLKWLMPPLFALWANLHGAAIFGLALLGSTALAETIEWALADRSAGQATNRLRSAGQMWVMTLVCAAAVLINAHGVHYYAAVLGSRQVLVDEWRPPYVDPVVAPYFFYTFGIIALAALAAWLANPRRKLAHLFWIGIGVIAFMIARRQIWLGTQLCVGALLAAGAWETWRLTRLSGIALAGWMGWCLQYAYQANPWPWRTEQPNMPYRLADYIKQRDLPGNMFNAIEVAGFLSWQLHDTPAGEKKDPLFISIFLESFPPPMLTLYRGCIMDPRFRKENFDSHNVGHIVLIPMREADLMGDFVRQTNADPDWDIAYRGTDGLIWVRRPR